MVDLGTLGGATSFATGINAQGQVVGYAATSSGATHAFLWTPSAPGATTGAMVDLGIPPGQSVNQSEAYAINDAGQVVGGVTSFVSGAAWRWSAADDMQDLGPTTSADRIALALNDNAQVAGALIPAGGGSARHAALWTVTLTTPPSSGPLPVTIDVGPGDGTNTLSLKETRDALVAVAVITTPDFDAPRLVNPGTARIGSTPVAARKKGVLHASQKDVDADGDADLVLHFERAQLVANGDLTAGTTSLVLRAELTDGRKIEGRDAVRVIKR
jgi:probable HAF family extracellular repeat protein